MKGSYYRKVDLKRVYAEVIKALFFFLLIPLFFTNSLFNVEQVVLTYQSLLF